MFYYVSGQGGILKFMDTRLKSREMSKVNKHPKSKMDNDMKNYPFDWL